jgi:flagellar motility protein MotE (MotC chaperone)
MIKKIIIIAAAGLVSFTGAFVLAWLTKPAPVPKSNEPKKPLVTASDFTDPDLSGLPEDGTVSTPDSAERKAMTEKRLKSLVFEVREKIQEYNNKLQALELQAQRLQVTREALQKDIEALNNLQIELTSTVAGLKEQRDELLKTRVDIDKSEKANFVSIAATYDKMDAASAGELLTNICKTKGQDSTVAEADSGLDDAVKILHYMAERTKAKVLAEMVSSEPQLASVLCRKLKQISEI